MVLIRFYRHDIGLHWIRDTVCVGFVGKDVCEEDVWLLNSI